MVDAILYGASYSVYVRAVRLALAEKSVAHRLVEVDVFAPGGPPPEHLARHPFGKIPAFEHDGFQLYETGAISRYVDDAFDGPQLQPARPRPRARMNQMISIQDNYVYPNLIWGLYAERIEAPRRGRATNEPRIKQLLPKAESCLAAMEAVMGEEPWLAGEDLSLADLHAAPMFDLFRRTPEGKTLMARHRRLTDWWDAVSARPSMAMTAARGI